MVPQQAEVAEEVAVRRDSALPRARRLEAIVSLLDHGGVSVNVVAAGFGESGDGDPRRRREAGHRGSEEEEEEG